MAFASGNQGGVMADINVTPLVDVMLVLLIIFMITTPLMNHKTKVDLPRAVLEVHKGPKDADPKVAPVTLSVRSNGDLFLDDEKMTAALLESKLAVIAQKPVQPVLNIRADRDVKMEQLKKMTTLATSVGMFNVGYVTVRPKPGEAVK